MMMGFSVLFIFALIHIFILYTGVNSEDLSNIKSTDSSNPLHLHPRGRFRRGSAKKEEDQRPFDINTNLEFDLIKDPPVNAFNFSDDFHNEYYILGTGNCKSKDLKLITRSHISKYKDSHKILVNKDNFEIIEWKNWINIENNQIQFKPVIFCQKYYIVKDEKKAKKFIPDIKLKEVKSRPGPKDTQTDILTLNNDIIKQHLEINKLQINEEKKSEMEEVLKHFSAENRNCKPVKHVVKLDHGSDKSRSFLKSRTHTFGLAIEGSVSGKILELVNVGGKLSLKYDQSRLNSETTSKLNKALQSVSVEIEVPPNHSCVIDIKSKTIFTEVPFSGQLTRQYSNGEERNTSITGIYDHEESDLESVVNPCKLVENGTKC